MKNISMKAALFCGAALAAVTTPFEASAQSTPAQLQEVVVTAQRRAERLEDVPMSVSVVSQEVLTNSGVSSVRDLANVTTGFQVGNGGSYPQPAIRGITTINAGSYENNVAVFVDGLYQATPQILNIDLPNVQNVQVLKGPQGTLYGRNATGGAILIDTIDPGSVMEGNAEATYGRFNDRRARGYVAGPITDSIGFSLAGTYRKTDGYIKQANQFAPGEFSGRFLGLNQQSLRGKLKFDVTDEFRVTLGSSYVRASDARGILFTPIENVSSNYAPGSGRDTRPRELGEAAGDVFDLDLKQYEQSLKLELDTAVGTLRSISGYTVGKLHTFFDFGGSYVPDTYSASIIRDRTIQQSLDFTIDAIDKVDLIVGGNYYNINTRYDGLPNTLFLGPAFYAPFTYPNPALQATPPSTYRKASETDFFRTKEAWAVFADVTFHATDQLSINVGGRYSHETQDVSGLKNNFVTATGPALGSLLSTPYTRASSAKSSKYSKFTPRASIVYEVLPNTNIYASYSKGFRGGEWNSVIPNDNPALWFDVNQEDVTAYEVGVKSVSSRLRFELAGFYYDYKNLQVSFTQNVNNVAVVTLQNAPSAEIYGAEGSFDYAVNENFNVRAGATWLHARYGDRFIFTGAGVNPALPGFNSNSDPLKNFQNITVSQDLSGLPMARSPNFTAFIGADYLIPNRDGGWRFSGNVKYTSSYVVTNPSVWGGDRTFNSRVLTDPTALPDNTEVLAGTPYVDRASKQRARQGGYVLINASVTWTDPEGHTYVRVWGNNLTNEKYRTHYNPISTGTYAPMAEPLTYGATVGYRF